MKPRKQKKKHLAKRRKIKPPNGNKVAELMYKGVKTLLSPVPYASPLFELLLTSPIEQQRRKWENEVSKAINFLETRHKLGISELSKNPEFVSVLLNATTVAIRNHRSEKIDALRNAIVNVAINDRGIETENLDLVFINYVDELTPLHIQVLGELISLGSTLAQHTSYPSLFELVSGQFQSITKDEFVMVMETLSSRGLIRLSPDITNFDDLYEFSAIGDMRSNDKLPRIIVTEIGKRFIGFITEQKA